MTEKDVLVFVGKYLKGRTPSSTTYTTLLFEFGKAVLSEQERITIVYKGDTFPKHGVIEGHVYD